LTLSDTEEARSCCHEIRPSSVGILETLFADAALEISALTVVRASLSISVDDFADTVLRSIPAKRLPAIRIAKFHLV
jgi:hypothetical protein